MGRGELFDRLKEYGADMGGIAERFAGDRDEYLKCLSELLDGDVFDELAAAVDGGERARAFDLARAARDMCHNLGLTPLYESACVLVEILRPGENETDAGGASAVKSARARMERVQKLFNDAAALRQTFARADQPRGEIKR